MYLVVTSDFKMVFLNEALYVIRILDMNSIRLVSYAAFIDDHSKLITAGIDGVFMFDFCYNGKYSPIQTSQIDVEGRTINIDIKNKVKLHITNIL